MADTDDTQPNLRERYKRLEGKFDPIWVALGASNWTLAAFLIWTIATTAFGFWAGRQ